jgi:peptide/nickel transport system permease protein
VLVARTFAQNKLAIIGVVVVLLVILFSFVGPLIYHTDQLNPNLASVNLGPGGGNPLGTDSSGFDILGRLMEGGQSSIEVGLAVGFVATGFGLIYGAISGYFGGVLDGVLMRLVDVGLAIPVVFLFIFMAQVFKPSVTLLIGLLALVSWQIPARLVRGETLSLRTREYVQAVKVMGGRSWRIILRHIIPNTIGTIMVTVTFQVANAILTLAVLQYLGFGLPPTTPTWGSMLSDGTTYLQDGYWWQVYPALVIIVITVVAFNFIGDALQDSFDVRLQER